jgi:hypothetical protein
MITVHIVIKNCFEKWMLKSDFDLYQAIVKKKPHILIYKAKRKHQLTEPLKLLYLVSIPKKSGFS